jgi:hypothetical protein
MSMNSIRRWASVVISALAALLSASLFTMPVGAQTVTAEEKPKKIALVSMVGDEFTVVIQRQSTGSNILDNYKRHTVRVPGQGINMSVLRGLDEAVRREHPESERIFLAIPHNMDTLPPAPQERERAAYEKAISLLTPMKERQDWDQIILVTPRWLFSERQRIAGKLSGIGLYIQPLESAKLDQSNGENGFALADLGLQLEEEVDTLKRGQTARSETFMAPFFYAVVTTLDAKTLRVIKRDERYDFRKVTNPDSTAIRIVNAFEPEQLAGVIDKFIETAALRSVTEKRGTVEIGPIRDSRATSTPPASSDKAPEKK